MREHVSVTSTSVDKHSIITDNWRERRRKGRKGGVEKHRQPEPNKITTFHTRKAQPPFLPFTDLLVNTPHTEDLLVTPLSLLSLLEKSTS